MVEKGHWEGMQLFAQDQEQRPLLGGQRALPANGEGAQRRSPRHLDSLPPKQSERVRFWGAC